ncbi:MAG: hypothetical protein MUF53_01790 [Gemmatimonadaceae bacterium]|jgi:hypothetical protein|nr:hypothetical protein [Gemmatimonadaceae bacterium]
MPAHPDADVMTCRACGRDERASEGYPCRDCGTFICLLCSIRGVTLCAECAKRAAPAAPAPGRQWTRPPAPGA